MLFKKKIGSQSPGKLWNKKTFVEITVTKVLSLSQCKQNKSYAWYLPVVILIFRMTSAWQHHDHQSCKNDNTKSLHDHRGNLHEIQAGVWKEKLDEQIIWIKNIQTELLTDKPRSDSASVRLPLHLETLPAMVTTTQDRWGRWINYWASHFNIDEDCLSGSMFSLFRWSQLFCHWLNHYIQ